MNRVLPTDLTNEKVLRVAASMIKGAGDKTIKALISNLGSCGALFGAGKKHLQKINGIGSFVSEKILAFSDFEKAEEELAKCQESGINLLFFTDEDYPDRLKNISDAPVLLRFKGNADLNNPKAIAIVGTRNCTPYGADFVEQLINDLRPHNPLIVSGLAYGIDIAAHKAALKCNLPTVGVMGTGMDIIYPSVHKKVANQMCEHGGLLTEYGFMTKPEAYNFPARNRIIAGMVDAVVVVEAKERGGALITAEIANSYNKDVFALPGNIGKSTSEGCNLLIRNHKANIITSSKDIEYMLGWDLTQAPATKPLKFNLDMYEGAERKILQTLLENEGELLIDDLSWKSQVPLNKLASPLLNLELSGVIKSLPGKKYKIV